LSAVLHYAAMSNLGFPRRGGFTVAGLATCAVLVSSAHAALRPGEEPPAAPAAESHEEAVLTGEVTREQVEEAVPDWVQAEVEAQPDVAVSRALAAVPPGAAVTVYLGTWCGDSKRELARLWRAFDQLLGESGRDASFAIRYVAVARDKKEPAALVEGSGLQYVPTFVVARHGREVGRIVETSPRGIELDLLALLDGSAHGVVSARTDLQPQTPPQP